MYRIDLFKYNSLQLKKPTINYQQFDKISGKIKSKKNLLETA